MTIFDKLRAPFKASEIDWRVGAKTPDNKKGLLLPYTDARCVRRRLNDVLGFDGWEVSFRPCERPGSRGWVCRLMIIPDGSRRWLTREDGADEPDDDRFSEPTKSAISGAFKRAAAMFGVGDYLYDLEPFWVPIKQRGNSYVMAGDPPTLPKWALPGGVQETPGGGDS